MTDVASDEYSKYVRELLVDVAASPADTEARARELLDRDDLDPATRSMAWRVVGLAERQLNHLAAAREALERAVEAAVTAGLEETAAEAQLSLALVVAYQGDMDRAVRMLDRVVAVLGGDEQAVAEIQRSMILQRLGRLDEALSGYDLAERTLRRSGNSVYLLRVLSNRGVLHTYAGDEAAAVADLEEARELAIATGQLANQAIAEHNLGFVAARSGDAPRAWRWFDAAEASYRAAGVPAGALHADRAEMFLDVGLVDEALEAAEEAVRVFVEGGDVVYGAEARALFALALLAAGRPQDARTEALTAAEMFAAQGRSEWAAHAASIGVEAGLEAGVDPAALVEAAVVAARDLYSAAWDHEATTAGARAVRALLAVGRVDEADDLLSMLSGRRRVPASQRIARWYSVALVRRARGDRRGLRRAVSAGLRELRRYRALLGASELRARSGVHGLRLVALAVEDALERGRAWEVLAAVDVWRGFAVTAWARPPRDPELARLLAELRRLEGEARRGAVDRGALARERAATEEAIRRRAIGVEGDESDAEVDPVDPERLAAALDGRTLVSYFRHRHELLAVVAAEGEARIRRLGPIEALRGEVESLSFALHRLSRTGGSSASLEAADRLLTHAAAAIDEIVVGMLGIDSDRVVLVPTGILHGLAWGALPSLFGRDVVVAPSVTAWEWAARAARPLDADAQAVLVAGPGLEQAVAEVESLARAYPRRSRFTGRKATVERVLGALDGADVAHLAAHGLFRADNPLFSSILLADGPLTVYDLEGLVRPPQVVVMPACDTARSQVVGGDEILGLSAALLGVGTAGLVAPVVPIPDTATRPLMTRFHRHLLRGVSPGRALAEAVATPDDGGPAERAVRRSFIAFGA